MDLKQELIDTILAADWSEADKALAVRVAADLSNLLILQLGGTNVDRELGMVKASFANLSAAAQVALWKTASSLVQTAIQGLFRVIWPSLVVEVAKGERGSGAFAADINREVDPQAGGNPA